MGYGHDPPLAGPLVGIGGAHPLLSLANILVGTSDAIAAAPPICSHFLLGILNSYMDSLLSDIKIRSQNTAQYPTPPASSESEMTRCRRKRSFSRCLAIVTETVQLDVQR